MEKPTAGATDNMFVSRAIRNWLSEMRISDIEMTRSHEDFVEYQIHEGREVRINLGLMKKFKKKQEIRSRQPKE